MPVHHTFIDSEIIMTNHRNRQILLNAIMPAMLACLLIAMPMAARAITAVPESLVAVNGSLSEPGDNVKYTGDVYVEGKVIDDLVFNSPQVLELVIDFSGVKGVGNKTGKEYITFAQSILHRPLKSKDTIEVALPFYLQSDPSDTRTVVASFEVSFNGANNVKMKLDIKPGKF
jgi:hypothetical protein